MGIVSWCCGRCNCNYYNLLIRRTFPYAFILEPPPFPRDPYNNLKKKKVLWQKLNYRDPIEITASYQEY